MATSQIASMLDELMGRNRNIGLDEKPRELHWSDPDVCKYFVVTFCPHELFTNTKADLGPCGKIHDEDLRTKFAEDRPDNARKMQFQEEFLRFCGRILSDLQVRIKKAKERLHLTQTEDALPPSASDKHRDVEEKLKLLSDRIAALVDEAEAAGTEGNVEQAQGLLKLSDQLREERDELRRSVMPFLGKEEYTTQQKAMEVCDICGAFLIVGDAQQRIDDHLMGKQHIGYAKLRAAVDKINEDRKKFREERDKEVEDRRRPREPDSRASREQDDSRSARGTRDKERDRDRDRERDRRDRERRRSRDRDRRRSRSRDRGGRRRSHSRDRSSRERRRSRSRDRKGPSEPAPGRNSKRRSRSRDRDRRKRSRSREDKSTKSHEENGSPREASSAAAQNQENVD